MKNKTLASAAFLLIISGSVYAQGSLEPPGAPAPTMKTLDQVEARIPVSGSGILASSGSYYLTNNVQGRITIGADNTRLDLNGFVVDGLSDAAIWVAGRDNVEIVNGQVINGTVFGAIAGSNAADVTVRDVIISDALHCASLSSPVGTIEFVRVRCNGFAQYGIRIQATAADTTFGAIIRDSEFWDQSQSLAQTLGIVPQAAIFIRHTSTGLVRAHISGNRIYGNLDDGIGVEPGSAASTGTITDNHVYGNAATGIVVGGVFIVARNFAQGNGTNYDLAAAANAAAVTGLAGSTSPWDNISE